ncbi:hypothetical protein U6A24_07195 [Aquimarina gracilis]|uniref:DKNYY family protein n=1 Tax=Aquimarina gracilis TaxID=874422 RepID=A0ABU5ZT62_9FLAO|nr:hypothetical protein [Aquimarina gracilis]MEB3345237.1 hypothetical protein [Aquimarina gracilis]
MSILRIGHHKLTLEKPEKIEVSNPFRYLSTHLNHFREEDRKWVAPYLQKIEWCKAIDRLEYATDESQYQKLKSQYIKESDVLYETNPERLKERITAYEHQNGLSNTKRYTRINIPGYWNAITYYDLEYKEGFYASDAGYYHVAYRINLLSTAFLKDVIQNDDIFYFMGYNYFEKAYNAINFGKESDVIEEVEKIRNQFKEQFINSYEKGISFLDITYDKKNIIRDIRTRTI